jgi:hypothetical protein
VLPSGKWTMRAEFGAQAGRVATMRAVASNFLLRIAEVGAPAGFT